MAGDQGPVRKRRRPALACEQCRRRKLRCDKQTPCTPCSKSNSITCTYLPDDRSVDGNYNPSRPSFVVSKAVEPSATPSPSSQQTGDVSPSIEALVERVRTLEQMLPNQQRPLVQQHLPTAASSATDMLKPTDFQPGVFLKTRFFGRSNFLYLSCLELYFDKAFPSIVAVENSDIPSLREGITECKSLAQSIKAMEIQEAKTSLTLSNLKDRMPPRATVDLLVEAYLRTFELAFRIFIIPTFRKDYERYWENPNGQTDEAFLIKLFLMMAIGSVFHPPSETGVERHLPMQWIFMAQSWLSSPSEKSRINIEGLQIQCLYLLARQANAVEGDVIWLHCGSVLRAAMHAGLHIDPSYRSLTPASTVESEIRRRLWATILEILVQSSMDVGGLPLIAEKDYSSRPPSNIDDWLLDSASCALVKTALKPLKQSTQSSVQIALTNSLAARLAIANTVNGAHPEYCSYQEALRLTKELQSALCDPSDTFQKHGASDLNTPALFHSNLYHILTARFLLVLHYPFATRAGKEPHYSFSRKLCLESSLSILNQPKDQDFDRLRSKGMGVFRAASLQAASYLCEELMAFLEGDPGCSISREDTTTAAQLRVHIENHLDHLKQRLTVDETNVKGILFFSALLGHIDALEKGQSVKESIVNSVKHSLPDSRKVLQARLEALSESSSVNLADLIIPTDIDDVWDMLRSDYLSDFAI